MIEFSMQSINVKYSNIYNFIKILNGYRQFDPTRGSSYILDVLLLNTENNNEVHKRLNVMRPLGNLEIIPMPYVTESSKINLVIAITSDYSYDEILKFFENYENFVLKLKETAEKINLYIIYFTTKNKDNSESYSKEQLVFDRIKENIKELAKKYSSLISTSSRILQDEIKFRNLTSNLSRSHIQLIVAEFVSKRLPNDALVFIGSPCIEFHSEFLNRIILNTIKNYPQEPSSIDQFADPKFNIFIIFY